MLSRASDQFRNGKRAVPLKRKENAPSYFRELLGFARRKVFGPQFPMSWSGTASGTVGKKEPAESVIVKRRNQGGCEGAPKTDDHHITHLQDRPHVDIHRPWNCVSLDARKRTSLQLSVCQNTR